MVADVGHVERRGPGQRHLDAGVPLHRTTGPSRRTGTSRAAAPAPGLRPDADASAACRCAGPPRWRWADCPGSRTRCCRPDDRRRARRRRGRSRFWSAGQVVGRAEARTEDKRRPGVAVLRDAVTGLLDAVELIARVPGIGVPINACVLFAPAAGRICPVLRVHRVEGVARAGGGAVAAARRRRAPARWRCIPLIGEEVRHLLELVVLRLLVREPHAVVERQAAVHLPVVLEVELRVVVDHVAFDELRRLLVLREDAQSPRWRSRSRCRAGCWCRCRSSP